MNIIFIVLRFILISFFIQIVIASILTLIKKPTTQKKADSKLSFNELFFDYSDLPKLKNYTARDNATLNYREYKSDVPTNKAIILIHGSGWHSQYFLPLAKHISSTNTANVYTPDLRGHGINPTNRGDIEYINQLEDDLNDFIDYIKSMNSYKKLILAGHSSGGGLVIRYAGSRYNSYINSYILLSPFLKYNAPTVRKNSGGWAVPYTPRIIGLSIFNTIRIHRFNYLPVIDFDMPEEARDGTETLTYSFRLNTGYAPRNYKRDLQKITSPLLVMAGANDESFYPLQFEPVISRYTKATFNIVENTGHMGIVIREEALTVIEDWINNI